MPMKRCPTIRDHKALQIELKCLKREITEKEREIKADTTTFVINFPKRIFRIGKTKKNPLTQQRHIANPTGKLLAKVVNKSIMRKQGFLSRFVAGIFAKKTGKVIEDQFLKPKPPVIDL